MKVLKILILFVIVLSGCSQKYLDSREEDLIDRKISASRKELDAEVVTLDGGFISLNIRTQDYIEVEDTLNVKDIYKYNFEQDDDETGKDNLGCFSGLGLGCVGCLMIGYEILEEAMDIKNGFGTTGAIGTMLCFSGCMFLTYNCLPEHDKCRGIDSFCISKNRKCIDSEILFYDKVKILVENRDSGKEYYTDEDGNIELSFEEIIPEPTEADSIISLIIQYEELVDTVDVKIK